MKTLLAFIADCLEIGILWPVEWLVNEIRFYMYKRKFV